MWSLGVLQRHQALIMSCEESGTRPWRCILITFVGPFRSTPFLLDVSVKNIWILKRVLCIWLLIRLAGYQVNKTGLPPLQLPLGGCECWGRVDWGDGSYSKREPLPSGSSLEGQVHRGSGSLPVATATYGFQGAKNLPERHPRSMKDMVSEWNLGVICQVCIRGPGAQSSADSQKTSLG